MTRITIVICDHCGHSAHGATDSYAVEGGSVMDICESCQKKPFKRVRQHPKAKAIAEVIGLAVRE